ncbi:MAG TPA: RNA polymerase sigma-54 factor [Nitrospirae bacterium]|nr:RNA polymerase sigma-54 factor [bacterium BMS3Abin09]GBE41162.1 RNA polymerase sigma-54 factor [bacterium BMS3Bbin09]HDH34024.1 RNA polymerase sigma-54 factor [Nitrospirota bacterium]HDN94820.1 RNA polymerase sigma-54 factor [Nitrospirota bacterium]HDO67526.1 RNA polymerase sigma-54 factor [Nitrospirota bacterium]
MAQEQKLELRLSHKLILTPQLQQSIKLLQLPLLELNQEINQELMNNPMLEEGLEGEPEPKQETTVGSSEEAPYKEPSNDIEAPLEKMFGFTTDNYFEERESDGRDLGYFGDNSEETTSYYERKREKESLYEHLLWQLRLSHASEDIGRASEMIINNLNQDGYLQASLEEIAESAELDVKSIEEALSFVQEFDPTGVGARNLHECLLLQLKPLGLYNTLVEKILTEGFTELEQKKFKQLAVKFKIPIDEIFEAIKIIEGLEPRPGRNYSGDDPIHIIPDVYLEESDGEFIITLNDEGIPRLRLSHYYRKLLMNKKSLGPEEKQFLEDKLRSAVWLLKSLDQRNKTIYRVTESILRFQDDFFKKGSAYLKPLNLKVIAEDLGLHESTISRVTSNKYIQCPQGLLSFRVFFSNAMPMAGGSISSSTVKDIIKQIVENEDPKKPLNDKKIVDMLNEKNIQLARRTAAKYREELKILSHTKRKKWF